MSIPLKPTEPRRLYQQVADQIRGLIHGGQFQPGTRLPAERDLAQQLGVSRPSLREALIALEIDGSVEIRSGSGVYVCAPVERAAGTTHAMGESPSELMQARSAIEGTVAALACARITPEGLASLQASIQGMRADIALGRDPLEQDRQFHLAIASLSGNSVLMRIVRELFDERHSPISAQLRIRFDSREGWHTALLEHEAIYAALECADPLLAQAAMRMHLDASKRRWLGE
ncbi:FadR/GntR family transcriptional regulator [Microvirga mediterraneensis]|uniref:FadR family transcriptional regulator n=1 Tax=Microvirga mediterraneensis TaxID=2754695 RepID=A0A838BKZ2_9HYPH|nr:FadR/GntR family transcriptional regulator [Microvirga mediterraneensis]MBA1156120.1 FadR family transcriptional regulator [Microvirga mediterraneensis]